MTVSQSNVIPVTNRNTLETVTLKNIIALDLVEKNEAVLKSLGLFDDTKTRLRYSQQPTYTTEKLNELIQSTSSQINILHEDISNLKKSLQNPSSVANKEFEQIKKLSSEFLQDDIPIDDVDELIAKFEKENEVKVIFDETNLNHHVINGTYLIKEDIATVTTAVPPPTNSSEEQTKDADNDVAMQ